MAGGMDYIYFLRPFYLDEIPDLIYTDVVRYGATDKVVCKVGLEDLIEWLTNHDKGDIIPI